jgi:hypothetical protein
MISRPAPSRPVISSAAARTMSRVILPSPPVPRLRVVRRTGDGVSGQHLSLVV